MSKGSPFGQPVPASETIAALPTTAGREAPTRSTVDPLRFSPRAPRYDLADVILPESAARAVRGVLAKAEHHRTLYEEWGLAAIDPSGRQLVFNLYGPPGTGKTMLAEALAKRLGCAILEVSYAELESKYVGETPKNITAAFDAARSAKAAIFFDEADSILGKRLTSVTQAADHSVNVSRAVMLKQVDAFDGVVIFATNLARNFDSAFVRRILFHIEIPLPDAPGRRRLWQRMIPATVPGREALSWDALGDASEGLAGGDIKNAVIMGCTEAVQRVGDGRKLAQGDLALAVRAVLAAKRDIGGGDPSEPAVSPEAPLAQGAVDAPRPG